MLNLAKSAIVWVMPENSLIPDSWHHSPPHRLAEAGVYFVTGSTYLRKNIFASRARLDVLHRDLLTVLCNAGWVLEAWSVFSNHYHFVARTPEGESDGDSLRPALTRLHRQTAIWVNSLDNKPGRQVWFNFRDTRLTYPASYYARLNYVIQNPVKHNLVPVASHYPWCSATWFEQTASTAQLKMIYNMKIDQVQVEDDFDPIVENDE